MLFLPFLFIDNNFYLTTQYPLQLPCDANPTGIAEVLFPVINGPILFASRSLTDSKKKY